MSVHTGYGEASWWYVAVILSRPRKAKARVYGRRTATTTRTTTTCSRALAAVLCAWMYVLNINKHNLLVSIECQNDERAKALGLEGSTQPLPWCVFQEGFGRAFAPLWVVVSLQRFDMTPQLKKRAGRVVKWSTYIYFIIKFEEPTTTRPLALRFNGVSCVRSFWRCAIVQSSFVGLIMCVIRLFWIGRLRNENHRELDFLPPFVVSLDLAVCSELERSIIFMARLNVPSDWSKFQWLTLNGENKDVKGKQNGVIIENKHLQLKHMFVFKTYAPNTRQYVSLLSVRWMQTLN